MDLAIFASQNAKNFSGDVNEDKAFILLLQVETVGKDGGETE